jgi:hypothetical protein
MTMPLPSHDEARSWPGLTMLDLDGDTVGRITRIYLDRDSGQPEWALVAVPERGRVFVPLSGAGAHDDRVRVAVAGAAVREAPEVATGRELSQQDATRLYRHYGVADGAAVQSARRAPSTGGRAAGAANRLREAGGQVRGVATSAPAKRLVSAAGAASALGAAAALAGRSGRRRGGLAGALDGLVAVPASAFRRRRRRQRVRATGRLLGSVAMAPVQAVGSLGAELGRRAPAPPRPLSRRRRSKMAGNFKLAAGLTAGYVLGARAGRERYERLVEAARKVADRPEVQQLAGKLRSGVETGVDKAASTAGDRLERARSARSTGPDERPQADQERPQAGVESQAGERAHAPEPSSADRDEERERSERSRARVRR